MSKISAIIVSKNEEKNIRRCLEGLRWCDEIIVIDDYSEDKTVEIAKSRGARVFKRRLKKNFAKQRNFGLKKAKNEWVLFLDADESLSPALRKEIVRRLKSADKEEIVGFYFKRKDFFINSWLNFGETAHVKLLRLARKNAGSWKGKIHEVWEVKGKTMEMKNPILHYPHTNLTETLKKINFYTSIRAKELFEQGKKTNVFQIIFYPLGKFLKNYIIYQGFRDTTAGLVFSMIMSLHSFLVRGKLYCLLNKQDDSAQKPEGKS